MPTEIESHMLDYQGNITKSAVFEETPELVTNVIQTTQKWGVILEWAMTGLEARRGDGHWKVRLFLESMGVGPEYDLPSGGPIEIGNKEGVWDPIAKTRTFASITGKLPVSIDPATDPVSPGTYRLTTTILYFDDSDVPLPVAGFYEGPMLEFYEPGP